MNLEETERRLLAIGPDHSSDVEPAYRAILAQYDAALLEPLLVPLITPYADGPINLDQPHNWTRVHAWRLLQRLHSAAGLQQMLDVAEHADDHLAYNDFVSSALAAGVEAAELLLPVIADHAASDTRRILAIKGMAALGIEHEQLRERAIATLQELIEGRSDAQGDVNGFAAEALMALAADCGSMIECAYLEGRIQVGSARASALGEHFGFEP